MSQDITRRRVVYEMPEERTVVVQHDLEFAGADGQPVAYDVYLPSPTCSTRRPAVVLVTGYPDAGTQKMLNCRFKEMQFTVSWGRLLAASGLAAVAYTNRAPAGDLVALIDHLSGSADAIGIDGRVGVMATSGNGALGLSMLLKGGAAAVRCGAFLYPYTLDLDGVTGVAEMAARFGFVNGCAGKSAADLRTDAPVFFARAGQDAFPHLNGSLDRLVAGLLAGNAPVTLVNYPAGVHAFDLMDARARSQAIVVQTLAFFRDHLLSGS